MTYKDYDGEVYTVLDVKNDMIALSLADYEDIEQDHYTNISELELVIEK